MGKRTPKIPHPQIGESAQFHSAPPHNPTLPVLIAIPAFNEAKTILHCVRSAIDGAFAAGLRPSVVVADDASTDATAELARSAGATVIAVAHRQIAAVRNSAARAVLAQIAHSAPAPDDMLIFIDGDTLVPEALFREARRAIDEGAVGGGARTGFDEGTPRWARLTIKLLGGPLLYWHGLAGGCFLYCRRDAFEAVGGFDEQYFAGEEIYFLRALKRLKRGKVRILKSASLTSGRKLRVYSTWRMLTTALRVIGTRGRTREGLDLWYSGERDETRSRS